MVWGSLSSKSFTFVPRYVKCTTLVSPEKHESTIVVSVVFKYALKYLTGIESSSVKREIVIVIEEVRCNRGDSLKTVSDCSERNVRMEMMMNKASKILFSDAIKLSFRL